MAENFCWVVCLAFLPYVSMFCTEDFYNDLEHFFLVLILMMLYDQRLLICCDGGVDGISGGRPGPVGRMEQDHPRPF